MTCSEHNPMELPDISPTAWRGESSIAVHAGERRGRCHDAITTPIVQTSTYTFDNTDILINYHEGRIEHGEYGRYGNPTVQTAEAKLAALEAGKEDTCSALLCSSGMNAVTMTLLAILPTGSHIVLTDDCYRRTRQFVTTFLSRLGIHHTVVPPCDYAAMEAAITSNTRLLLSESPSNPYLRVLDMEQIVKIAQAHHLQTIIDATFATPYNIRPLDYGVDLVLHSATKYLGGHNDLLAGVVIGRESLISPLRDMQAMTGGICDPNSAYLLLRGLKTFVLRMERHNTTAMAVARFLQDHPRIERVHYPGLESHPDYVTAVAQMRGFGGVVSCEIAGNLQETSRFVDRLQMHSIAPSLGSVESMVVQPAIMSFYDMHPEERQAIGIRDNLVRLACGIEDPEDIIADLAQALEYS